MLVGLGLVFEALVDSPPPLCEVVEEIGVVKIVVVLKTVVTAFGAIVTLTKIVLKIVVKTVLAVKIVVVVSIVSVEVIVWSTAASCRRSLVEDIATSSALPKAGEARGICVTCRATAPPVKEVNVTVLV